MVGYHNNPAANEEVFLYRNGKKFFRTGDMGHMVEGKVTMFIIFRIRICNLSIVMAVLEVDG
jgi:long-subunit acyl-CoA synthetase (AMP-forming)